MKKILLALVAAACLPSCTLDSVSYGVRVDSVSYPVRRVYVPPVYRTGVYTSYHYDLRPDYRRYGSYCPPVRRRSHCHH